MFSIHQNVSFDLLSINIARFLKNKPSIDLKGWTEGYNWARSEKDIISKSFDNDKHEYYCPVGDEHKVTQDQISTVKDMRWNTFEQFKKRAFSVWIVSLVPKSETWREGTCTCPNFLKKYMCKHLIGMAIRLKLAKPPPAAKNVPINEKRRRGRPKFATKALLRD